MPTYKNNTNLAAVLSGKVVSAGQVVHSLSYHDEDEVGLRLIDEKPYYNPLLLSMVVKQPCTIEIPKKDALGKFATKYSLHFYVEEGTVRIHYNSVSNNPPLNLYTGAKWNVRHFERHVDKLIIGATLPFTLYVIIEKIV